MTATRASKRSAAKKTVRGLDESPSRRTHSQTLRDRLRALLLKLDPAATMRAVKVRKAYDEERSSPQSLASVFGSSTMNIIPISFKTSSHDCDVKLVVALAEDLHHFNDNVLVIKDDIGSITHLGDHKIDGIAFPTTPNLRNSGTSAAAAVFRRAGDSLSTYVQGINPSPSTGIAYVTDGFNAGVDTLIHAVGPSASDQKCYSTLYSTYLNVMKAARRNNLQCLALASILTGSDGDPCNEAARIATRAIQNSLSNEKWPCVVGIVCNDQEVFDAFTQEKHRCVEFSYAQLQVCLDRLQRAGSFDMKASSN